MVVKIPIPTQYDPNAETMKQPETVSAIAIEIGGHPGKVNRKWTVTKSEAEACNVNDASANIRKQDGHRILSVLFQ